MINAGADTAFRVALGGHQMTVTHTDGYPVVPIDIDALLIGMGERYDVIVTPATASSRWWRWPKVRTPRAGLAVRTGAGSAPDPAFGPAELDGRRRHRGHLVAADTVLLPRRRPDAEARRPI